MTLVCTAHGCVVAVDGPAPLLEIARRQLPPHYASTDADPEVVLRVTGDHFVDAIMDREVVAQGTPEAAVRAGVSRLELWVAEHAPSDVLLHAGAVSVDGRVLLLPGRSHVGKSRLVASLLDRGARYLSDEYAVVDAAGRVRAYPRALSLRSDDGSVRREAPLDVDDRQRLPVTLVALLAYRADLIEALDVRPLSPGELVLALLDNAPAARRRPAQVLDAVSALSRGATSFGGGRAEAGEAAGALLARLS